MGMVVVRAAAVGFLAEHTVAARLWGWGVGGDLVRATQPPECGVRAPLLARTHTPRRGVMKHLTPPNAKIGCYDYKEEELGGKFEELGT